MKKGIIKKSFVLLTIFAGFALHADEIAKKVEIKCVSQAHELDFVFDVKGASTLPGENFDIKITALQNGGELIEHVVGENKQSYIVNADSSVEISSDNETTIDINAKMSKAIKGKVYKLSKGEVSMTIIPVDSDKSFKISKLIIEKSLTGMSDSKIDYTSMLSDTICTILPIL